MSSNATGQVWKQSRAKGSNLLALLAIADVADEQGRNAWPSPEHLAAKTRMSARAMRLILHKLERDGELSIELNTDRRVAKTGYTPPFFLHVRCVYALDRYLSGESEDISETVFVRGRRPSGKPFRKRETNKRKSFPHNRNGSVPKSENTRTAYKDDPSVDPLVELEQGAAPPSPRPNTTDPDECLAVITRLVHDTFDALGPPRDGERLDFEGLVKQRCSDLHIPYNTTVVGKAIDSALVQRSRPRSAPAVS